MPTSNIEFLTKDDIEIRVNENIQCGKAYLVDISFLTDPKTKAFVGKCNKRFIGFVCCEKQKKSCEENIEEVVKVINQMVNDKVQAFITDNHRTIN